MSQADFSYLIPTLQLLTLMLLTHRLLPSPLGSDSGHHWETLNIHIGQRICRGSDDRKPFSLK